MVYPQVMDDKCLQVDPHDGRTVTGFDWGSPIIRIMAFRGLHRVPYLERYNACWGSSGRPGQCRQLQGQVQSAMGGAGIAKPVYVEHIVSFLGIPASSSSKLKGCVALAIQGFRALAMALQKRHRLVVLRSGLSLLPRWTVPWYGLACARMNASTAASRPRRRRPPGGAWPWRRPSCNIRLWTKS